MQFLFWDLRVMFLKAYDRCFWLKKIHFASVLFSVGESFLGWGSLVWQTPFFFFFAYSVPCPCIQRARHIFWSIISQSVMLSIKAVSSGTGRDNCCLLWELRITLGFCLKWFRRKHNEGMLTLWKTLCQEGWKLMYIEIFLCARQFMRHLPVCYLNYHS